MEGNTTLYIRNLNEKIPKEDLRRMLYMLGVPFGPVLDVVAVKTLKMRGQAFLVFQEGKSSKKAKEYLDGYKLMGKAMEVDYAKTNSDAWLKWKGEFNPQIKIDRLTRRIEAKKTGQAAGKRKAEADLDRPQKKRMNIPVPKVSHPFHILFVQNLRGEEGHNEVLQVFRGVEGLVEVRMVETRPDIAFVEYDTVEHAVEAVQKLQFHEITPGFPLVLSYREHSDKS